MLNPDTSIENKLKQIKENLQSIHSKITKLAETSTTKLVCYFTNSINIVQNEKNFIIGSLHLTNYGHTILKNPIFLIQITSDQELHLSGKFSQKGNNFTGSTWKRIELDPEKEKSEYWFQPTEMTKVNPGETISFSNFQVTWEHCDQYNLKIEGFAYCDEAQNGVPALSPVILFS